IFFASSSVARMLTPVMLLPAFAKLAASPEFTRSSPTQTIGSNLVAALSPPPRRFSRCKNYSSAVAHQRFSEFWKPVEFALGETHVEAHVLAVNEHVPRARFP